MEKFKFFETIINKLHEYSVMHPEHDTDEIVLQARKELEEIEQNYVLIKKSEHATLKLALLDNPNTTSEQLEELYYKFQWTSARYKIFRHPNFSDKLFEIYKENPETEFFTTLNQKQLREADEISGLTPSKPSTTA